MVHIRIFFKISYACAKGSSSFKKPLKNSKLKKKASNITEAIFYAAELLQKSYLNVLTT